MSHDILKIDTLYGGSDQSFPHDGVDDENENENEKDETRSSGGWECGG